LNLFRLLENLLNWSSIRQGLTPFSPAVIPLNDVVKEGIASSREPANIKGIEISCHIPEDMMVFADNRILQAVIRNLVSNAVKFTKKNGKIDIHAVFREDKSVEISIHDTGIGMNRSMTENLFRLDVQNNRPGTDGEISTGLGLLLCK
jgi:signal transduction histidine kinase